MLSNIPTTSEVVTSTVTVVNCIFVIASLQLYSYHC